MEIENEQTDNINSTGKNFHRIKNNNGVAFKPSLNVLIALYDCMVNVSL